MQAHKPLQRLATVLAAALTLVLFVACGGVVKISSPAAPTAATPAPPTPQAQPSTPPRLPEPVVRLRAYELFDKGQQGEDQYKGKVVAVSGLVDVDATQRPGPGGTSTLVVKGRPGEPPYARATFGHDSEELLFCGHYQPPSVSLQGTYRGRDEQGTVLLDDAKVTSLTNHFPEFSFRPDNPGRPQNPTTPGKSPTAVATGKPQTPPAPKKSTPVSVSAEELAQALQDDLSAAYKRYYGVPLLIDGVITKQTQVKGAITMLQMAPAVTDKKTNKPVDFAIFCGLRRRVSSRSSAAADLAEGKRVRLLGTLSAAGNGQATLGSCVLQK